MKRLFLLAILASALSGNTQSLKDALYSGKLKMDTGTVIRKSDDWTSKIDTTTKKPVEVEIAKTIPARDSSAVGILTANDSVAASPSGITGNNNAAAGDNSNTLKTENAEPGNNKLWKDYMTEFIGTLKTDVLPSKKLKNGTYSVLVDYEIDTDGQIEVKNVSSSPENSYLEQQVKERITLGAPKLTPLLNAYGKPRKAAKKYTFTISK